MKNVASDETQVKAWVHDSEDFSVRANQVDPYGLSLYDGNLYVEGCDCTGLVTLNNARLMRAMLDEYIKGMEEQ